MSQVFFAADTHFKHPAMVKHRQFPDIEQHDAQLIENWNQTVGKRDTIFLLGDFMMFSPQIIEELRGEKVLVLGNHDDFPLDSYPRYGFKSIRVYVSYKGYLLSHIPVHPQCLGRYKNGVNIHGHLHDQNIQTQCVTDGCNLVDMEDPRYVCVSMEQIDLTPISFDALQARINERKLNFKCGSRG